MKYIQSILCLIAGTFLLSSCFQEERSYILNPDGSGKVEFQATFPLDSGLNLNFNDNDNEEQSPEAKARQAVTDILEESEGVAAWTNVTYKITDEAKLAFHGTAYFPNLNKVKLKMGSISANNLLPTWKSEKGLISVECLPTTENEEPSQKKKQPDWADMTEKERSAALAKTRQELLRMKAMMAAMTADMSSKVTIHLPATAKSFRGFEKLSETAYSKTSSGEMMLKGIDALIADDKLLRSIYESDRNLNDAPPEELFQAMFGDTGIPSATFAANAPPAFDYKKEVAAAQKATPAMLKKLGLSVVAAPAMMGEAKFKSLRLAGLRIVTSSPDDQVRPFNWFKGFTLALIGELPGAVISAEAGTIESFTLDNGQNLLSTNSRSNKPQSIDLSEDGTLLGFEIQCDQLPKADATMIKKLKGELICIAAGNSTVTDLAFPKIAVGEQSTHYGAKITELAKHDYQKDKKKISIHFDLKKDMIKSVQFFDADGILLKSEQNGYSWSGKSGELSFSCSEELSEDCTIKLEVFADLKRHALPFLLENVPLLPRQP